MIRIKQDSDALDLTNRSEIEHDDEHLSVEDDIHPKVTSYIFIFIFNKKFLSLETNI